jgi:hypothetical protein
LELSLAINLIGNTYFLTVTDDRMIATKQVLILIILLFGVILVICPCNGYKSPSLVFLQNSNVLSQSHLVKSNINLYQSISDNKINNTKGSINQMIFSPNTPIFKSNIANLYSASMKNAELTLPIKNNEYNNSISQNFLKPNKIISGVTSLDSISQGPIIITDEILRAYEKNLTKNQLKLSSQLLILIDPNHPYNLYGSLDQKKGTYDALIKTGIIIPAYHSGLTGPAPSDLILVSIYLNSGSLEYSIDAYLYEKVGYDTFYNSVVAWVPLNNIEKIADSDDVRLIDTPIAPINYQGVNKE